MPEPSWTLCGGFIFASQASAYGGDLNRSMQHFILDSKDGVCAMKRKYHRVGFTAAQKAELSETVKAIVSTANDDLTEQEIIQYCGESIAH